METPVKIIVDGMIAECSNIYECKENVGIALGWVSWDESSDEVDEYIENNHFEYWMDKE